MNDGHVPDPDFIVAARPRPPRRLEYGTPCCGTVYGAPTMDALVAQLQDHLRNCTVFRNDVTCRRCPALEAGDNSTHHLIPRRVGTMRGEPVFEHVCQGCSQKAAALRNDSAIEAAVQQVLEVVRRRSAV